jgi:calcium-dependent protein kinase
MKNDCLDQQHYSKTIGLDFVIEPSSFIFHKTHNIYLEYNFGPKIGNGSFGSVRRAVKKETGQERAIKTIRKSLISSDMKKKTKFFTEVDILKQTDHPNIVKFYEFFEDSKHYHLVTEIVQSGELFDYITSSKTISESIAAHFIKQVLSAVHYCHSKGIVHRDLKPENLLLERKSSDSILKVIDFGTSALFDPKKKLTHKYGTSYYIAPEVLEKNYNEKCDIWSCGVILFVLLSGMPPFYGENDEEIISKVRLGQYSFNSKEWKSISNEAKAFISQMLELNVRKRLTAYEALNHEWIVKNLDKSQRRPVLPYVFNNLQRFHIQNKFQHAVLSFISGHLANKQEIQELSEIFQSIDENGDGKLSREELLKEYSKTKPLEIAEEEVENIMKEVDVNNSGYIDYSEFLMASLERETLLSKNNLETAFKVFDQDSSGKICCDDLKRLFGNNSSDWEDVMSKIGSTKNGFIDLKEFISIMLETF